MNINYDLILSIGYCQSVFCYYTTMPGDGGIYMYVIDSYLLVFKTMMRQQFFKNKVHLKKIKIIINKIIE